MAPSAATQPTNPQDHYRWYMIAGGVAAIVLAVGLFIFASNVENRELYHGWYLLAFFFFTAFFGAALGLRQFILSGVMLAIVAGILTVSSMKFSWRQELVAQMNDATKPSVLGDYAPDLPPLEDYWLSETLSKPNWVAFDRDCYQPALTGGTVAEACKNSNQISGVYRIDVRSLIESRFQQMKQTAVNVENKSMPTKMDYFACLNGGGCQPVPLLPANADMTLINERSPEYKDIRIAFWELIEKTKMTAPVCDFIPLCKAMTTTGAITRSDFQTPDA